jgi:hypothetical protein
MSAPSYSESGQSKTPIAILWFGLCAESQKNVVISSPLTASATSFSGFFAREAERVPCLPQ